MQNFFKNDNVRGGLKSLITSIICILIGLVVGLIVMIVIALTNDSISIGDAFEGIGLLMSGPFASTIKANQLSNVGNMVFYSVPLIMTGLSVAIAYKTGLFNIGAPGQYIMGTIGSLTVALSIHTSERFSGIMVWLLALIVGMLLGMLWGAIPGILKAFFNINEVIICIMTNWIAANISSWFFTNVKQFQSPDKGGYLIKVMDNYTPKLGFDKLFPSSYIDGGIVIAIIIAIVVLIMLNKTTFGYELKACGFNKNAAKYAGLNEKRNIILSMCIAGGLAGLGASFYFLNPGIEYKYISQYSNLPAYGFNGIASAFLANCNPVGTIFSSLLIRYINMGGDYLNKVGFNRYIADIIIAVIIYLAGFTRIMRELIEKIIKKANDKKQKEQESNQQQPIEEITIPIDEIKNEEVNIIENNDKEENSVNDLAKVGGSNE